MFVIIQVDTVYEGKTALHVAIEEGSPTAVKLLLEYNANMELQV
jgi:ankyrin repeat protein